MPQREDEKYGRSRTESIYAPVRRALAREQMIYSVCFFNAQAADITKSIWMMMK